MFRPPFSIADSIKAVAVNRDELLIALIRAMRESSGLGVLHSQVLAESLGISSTDVEYLDCIMLRGPMTAGELARATSLTTGAITGVIDRLERAGYAKRKRDPADRRKILVWTPPAAERRVAPLSQPMQAAFLATLSIYDDKELELLLCFLLRTHEAAATTLEKLRARIAASKKAKSALSKSGSKLDGT